MSVSEVPFRILPRLTDHNRDFWQGGERGELVSRSARLAYPIRDGIPVMLEEEARKLTPEEWEALKD